MSSFKGFLVESIFLAFEAPQGSWDALFDPFLTISDLLFLGIVGLYGRFSFSMFSACLRLSTSTRKFPFLIFLMFFGVSLVEITFSIKKDENLAR